MENFKKCIEKVRENSKDAPVFVLIHKMDRVASESKVKVSSINIRLNQFV